MLLLIPPCSVLSCFTGCRSSPDLNTACAARSPAIWSYIFHNDALIYGLELLALVIFFEDHADSLMGDFCWIYLDNNKCLVSLVRGDSNAGIIATLVARFWQLAQRCDICARFSRVRSDLIPSDLPTRGKKLPLHPRYRAGFSSFRPLSARCRAALSALSDPPRIRCTRVGKQVRQPPRRAIRV